MRFIFIFSFIFIYPLSASANLIFTEVAYDLAGSDTDREWVEILNTGSDTVDLTGYKFNDGANHVLNPPPENGGQGSFSVGSGEYFILSGDADTFVSEYPSFSGTVIDTVMSLANTGDTLKIINPEGDVVSELVYLSDDGGAGDGSTLSFIDGGWQSGSPSPGLASISFNNSNDENINDDVSSSDGNNIDDLVPSNDSKEKPKQVRKELLIETAGISKSLVSGTPSIFSTTVYGLFDEKLATGRFLWSLGDGGVYESIGNEAFYYTYKYPGEYVVTLRYFKKAKDTKIVPDQIVRKNITVTSPNVIIETVDNDGSLVLVNESVEERDIGGWSIVSNGKTFTFPEYTIILPKKRFTLSPHISNISVNSLSSAILFSKNKEVIYRYPKIVEKSYSPSFVKKNISSVSEKEYIKQSENQEPIELSADVNKSSLFLDKGPSLLSLFGLILLAIIAVFSVRRFSNKNKNDKPEDGSSFELVE